MNAFYLPLIHLLGQMDRYKFSIEASTLIQYIDSLEKLKENIIKLRDRNLR